MLSRAWLTAQLRAMGPLALGAMLCLPATATEPVVAPEPEPPALIASEEYVASESPVASEPPPAAPAPSAAEKKKLAAAVKGAYKGVFYDNNFDYLCNPAYDDWHLGENFKRLCIGDHAVLDIGGEYRARYQNEQNMRGLGLTGLDDDFMLHRTRVYMNSQIGERVRVYAEYIDAESNNEQFAPRGPEVNRSDMLNLFGDYTIWDSDDHGKLIGRVGRQELLYGDQRLISPLDWANTRRTFDGAKMIWTRDDWRADGFWAKPVIPNAYQFDSPDEAMQFYGIYSTYSGIKDHTLDFYWLGFQSDRPMFPGEQQFAMQTAGSRWAATHGPWLSVVEGAYQFGTYGNEDHSAGFFTLGGGHKWDDVCWKPVLWTYFDWASGDSTLGNGFNQLFPLGHRYLGFIDFYARSNIQDLNASLTVTPHEKLTLLTWWHLFYLQDQSDVPYHVGGRPVVTTAGGNPYLGQELDLLLTYQIAPRSDIVLGYSHFFTGDWYRTNPQARTGYTGDADFFYGQFTVRF